MCCTVNITGGRTETIETIEMLVYVFQKRKTDLKGKNHVFILGQILNEKVYYTIF